jgi:hypothetical protein
VEPGNVLADLRLHRDHDQTTYVLERLSPLITAASIVIYARVL